jgi:charged multivesicular body protein 2A
VSHVLAELGLQLRDQLSGLPQAPGSLAASWAKAPAVAGGGAGAVKDADAVLQARTDMSNRVPY